MKLKIGVPAEIRESETRVALSPDVAKKLLKQGFKIQIEKGAGEKAGFPDAEFSKEGVQIAAQKDDVFKSDIIFKINKPNPDEILKMRPATLFMSLLEPYKLDGTYEKLAEMKVNAIALELLPRTSRAQSMDVLSSQANIAGYRAVLEAATKFGRFFPMMMTSAGSAKPAKVAVLGVGVAGLQAISTAKRLGATVEAYDVRPEVKEQILSVGAKPIELDLGETGTGQGGYAKELSDQAKEKQRQLLAEKLKKFDIIITTANIPGRASPILVTEEAVKGMKPGSVIVDMAAANGGNCPLIEKDKITCKHGVNLIGWTNYNVFLPADSSSFFAKNLMNILNIMFNEKDPGNINYNLEDDIIAASLITLNGEIRHKKH